MCFGWLHLRDLIVRMRARIAGVGHELRERASFNLIGGPGRHVSARGNSGGVEGSREPRPLTIQIFRPSPRPCFADLFCSR